MVLLLDRGKDAKSIRVWVSHLLLVALEEDLDLSFLQLTRLKTLASKAADR